MKVVKLGIDVFGNTRSEVFMLTILPFFLSNFNFRRVLFLKKK